MLRKEINNIIRIPTELNLEFFKYWFEFLKPFHSLTEREIDVISSFIKLRYELGKVIRDETILDDVVMSEESKRKVREEAGVSLAHFQVIMGKLRKSGVIVDGRLNHKFIPNIDEGNSFKLLLYFDFGNVEGRKKDT